MLGRRNKKDSAPKAPASLTIEEICEQRASARIATLHPRQRVAVVGEVRHVCSIDLDGTPGFEIEVNDGTGSIVAQWTGRRSIRCIEPGRRLALYGRAAPQRREDALVVYNPRYELLP